MAVDLYNGIQEFTSIDAYSGFTLLLGDMSASNGRDPWQSGFPHHSGHGHNSRSGLDVDIRYFDNQGNSYQGSNAYLQGGDAVDAFFRVMQDFGFNSNYTYGTQYDSDLSTSDWGHRDHIHIGHD